VIDRYDEELGRIHHELRIGEFSVNGRLRTHRTTAAATRPPCFLTLLEDHPPQRRHRRPPRKLEPNARATLEWIGRFGDRDDDG
jgi:hypothetical protein